MIRHASILFPERINDTEKSWATGKNGSSEKHGWKKLGRREIDQLRRVPDSVSYGTLSNLMEED